MKARLCGYSALGPGFDNTAALGQLMQNGEPIDGLALASPKPELIPPRERRRSPLVVRLAVEAATQAVAASGHAPESLCCVFASSMADTDITDYMCRSLKADEPALSPTKFHNSVHNAAAGYWTISTGCAMPANSVAAFEQTVPVALLEAIGQCLAESRPVLLVFFDAPVPTTLIHAADITQAFGAALVLEPFTEGHASHGIVIEASLGNGHMAWPELGFENLTGLYNHNPSARLLALFKFILSSGSGQVDMPLADNVYLSIKISGVPV